MANIHKSIHIPTRRQHVLCKKRERKIKIMQEHVNDNVNQYTFFLFIFERRSFLCVRTSKHDFQLGLLITPLCSRVWIHERDTFYFEFPHSGTFFFIVARIFRQSFSFHIGILKGSSFFLGLALECWCAQLFTFPFILYCLIVSLFCVSFLNFPLFLWIWKCRRPLYWSFELFFDVSQMVPFW